MVWKGQTLGKTSVLKIIFYPTTFSVTNWFLQKMLVIIMIIFLNEKFLLDTVQIKFL